MQPVIAQLETTRALMVKVGDGLTPEQRTTIPAGFANHILWNLGHVAVTLRLLCYKLAGREVGLDEDMVAQLRKGSSPADWTREYSWDEIRVLLLAQPGELAADYAAGGYGDFSEYTTSAGVTLASIDDAIAFNQFHEGIHLGYILAQRKAIGA